MVETEVAGKVEKDSEKKDASTSTAAAPAPVPAPAAAAAGASGSGEKADDGKVVDAQNLEEQIIRQVEYYFGDVNLSRDKFLRAQIEETEGGWVTLTTLLTFKRLASLSTDKNVIVDALGKSEAGLIEISEDREKLRRNPIHPLPQHNEEYRKEMMSRTAYCKGFPLDSELTDLLKFFTNYEKVQNVTMRKYLHKPTKAHKFKGSVFATFESVEQARSFVNEAKIEYKGRVLIRKMQLDYLESKRAEIQKKRAKKEQNSTPVQSQLILPKGSVLGFEKATEGLTRELIRSAIDKISDDFQVAFIDFNKGDISGRIRFTTEGAAKGFLKLLENNKLKITDCMGLELKALEEEDEKAFLQKAIEEMLNRRRAQRSKRPNNRKRRPDAGGSTDNENKKQKV